MQAKKDVIYYYNKVINDCRLDSFADEENWMPYDTIMKSKYAVPEHMLDDLANMIMEALY